MKKLPLILAGYTALTNAPEEQKIELRDVFHTPAMERIVQHSRYSDLSSLGAASVETQGEIMKIPSVIDMKAQIQRRNAALNTHMTHELKLRTEIKELPNGICCVRHYYVWG